MLLELLEGMVGCECQERNRQENMMHLKIAYGYPIHMIHFHMIKSGVDGREQDPEGIFVWKARSSSQQLCLKDVCLDPFPNRGLIMNLLRILLNSTNIFSQSRNSSF